MIRVARDPEIGVGRVAPRSGGDLRTGGTLDVRVQVSVVVRIRPDVPEEAGRAREGLRASVDVVEGGAEVDALESGHKRVRREHDLGVERPADSGVIRAFRVEARAVRLSMAKEPQVAYLGGH